MDFLKKYKSIMACLLLVTTTMAVYWQVQGFDFINYDDTDYIVENINVQKGLTPESIAWAFRTFHAANWHPMTWLSHMADCQLFGLNPGPHHLTSLFFHIINTLLLFFIFRKMTHDFWQSIFVAALFAVHPLHVESVAWVSERKDVLSTFFALLTIQAYIRYVRQPVVYRYVPVILFFCLGLMSKPMLVTLPFVLLLLDYWPLNRLQAKSLPDIHNEGQSSTLFYLVRDKIPLFILVVISCGITFYAQNHGGAVKPLDFIPLDIRIENAIVAYATYIGKMIYPVHLAFLYPYPERIPLWKIAGSGLLLVAISFLAIKTKRQHPYFITGWLWYLGTLVPVIGLVQVGGQSMADRYTYIPLIGLFIMISWGIPEILQPWRFRKIFLWVFSTILIILSAGLTWKQAGYWKSSISLFEHAIKTTSANYVAHYNLGNVLAKKGRADEAIFQYLQSLKIKPEFVDADNNLANVYLQQGHPDKAMEYYLKVLAINPGYEGARYNMGIALDDQGRAQEAIPYFLDALKGMPDNAEAYFKTANALIKSGNVDGAIQYYQEALRIQPDFVNAHCNLGVALFRSGDVDGAVMSFRAALRLKPDFKTARQYLQKALSVRAKK